MGFSKRLLKGKAIIILTMKSNVRVLIKMVSMVKENRVMFELALSLTINSINK
jgi:bisphosphoglycerate-dependent phosphoglycerate mutase